MANTKRPTTWKNLGLRVASALVLVAICALPIYLGGALWALLVFVIGLRVIWEWVTMTDPTRQPMSYFVPMAGFTICVTYAYLGYTGYAAIALFLTAFAAFAEKSMRLRDGDSNWAAFGVFYIFLPCLAAIFLRDGGAGLASPGFRLMLYIILVVVAADTGAYFGGSYFQGPKLAPKLSPKKTWSGLISGIIAGMIVGAACSVFMVCGPFISAALAFPIVILSVCGDFLESSFKRRMNVKDAGDILPGHGGLLDRLDSFMVTLPVIAFISFFWPFASIV